MKLTIGDFISRIRRLIKAINQDAFLTDRFLYSVIYKHGSWLMKREDSANKLLTIDSIIQVLDMVVLIEVDKVQAGCRGLNTHCKIMRTEEPLPELFEGYAGPLIRYISSLDSSEEINITDPITYLNMTKQSSFKYNKTKYVWYLDGHLFFPNLEWDAVRIEGIFDGDIAGYNCNECKNCISAQERLFSVPQYLHAELESKVLNDLRNMYQIPQDPMQDNQHPARN
jgi:hypothetical protein